EQLKRVPHRLAALVQGDGPQADAVLVDLRGVGGPAARRHGADVQPVSPAGGEPQQRPVVVEDGAAGHYVVEVRADAVGVVDQVDVAGLHGLDAHVGHDLLDRRRQVAQEDGQDRKSTRLNSSHVKISYAVF